MLVPSVVPSRAALVSVGGLLLLAVTGACAASQGFDAGRALGAESLEVQLDSAGKPVEIEYRIPPGQVPEKVRAGMDRMHPGDALLGAEIEFREGQQLFHLERLVDGKRVSAVFRPDGTLAGETLEIDATRVPAPVHETVRRAFPRASGFLFSMRRNGNQELLDYRVRLLQDGLSYEAAVYANGHMHRAWRQIRSEIDVPVELR